MVAIIAGWRNLKKKMVLGISEISDACVVYCLVVGLLVSWLVSSINAAQGHWLIACIKYGLLSSYVAWNLRICDTLFWLGCC